MNCGPLTAPSNGAKSGDRATYLSVVTFSCNTGYTLGGSSSRTCQADGSWSGNTTSCTSNNATFCPAEVKEVSIWKHAKHLISKSSSRSQVLVSIIKADLSNSAQTLTSPD